MSDTPRTDAIWNDAYAYRDGGLENALYSLAQDLEREVRQWEERWKSLQWCHSGCKEGTAPDIAGGPTIGWCGGILDE